MGAALHRIEPLPGDGRYALTFRRPDGIEQTAVVHLTEDGLDVAEASLPTGWTKTSDVLAATAAAVRAFDAARRLAPPGPALRDVDGGWDVSLGNVVLGPSGVPACTAHGDMATPDEAGAAYSCAECGAQALLG